MSTAYSSPFKSVIALAGAGRGGLVSRCLVAFERSNRRGIVYAIEKNPSAFVTSVRILLFLVPFNESLRRLQARKEAEWGDKVQILHGDMRVIEIPEKADILVSELLGSFGDNELSPECLDGAMRFLGRKPPLSWFVSAYKRPPSGRNIYTVVVHGASSSYIII